MADGDLLGMDLPESLPAAVSKKHFAQLAGITPGRVSQLIEMGLPVQMDGRIDLAQGRAWYAENVRQRTPDGALGERAQAKADRERYDAELARMRMEERAGLLIDASAVRMVAFERARMERDAHLGFAASLASVVAAELNCDQARAFVIIDREMREHLTRLAQTPAPFSEASDGNS